MSANDTNKVSTGHAATEGSEDRTNVISIRRKKEEKAGKEQAQEDFSAFEQEVEAFRKKQERLRQERKRDNRKVLRSYRIK